jgi:hypothetical protein
MRRASRESIWTSSCGRTTDDRAPRKRASPARRRWLAPGCTRVMIVDAWKEKGTRIPFYQGLEMPLNIPAGMMSRALEE